MSDQFETAPRRVNPFPVTALDKIEPTDPKAEPTRAEVNARPETPVQQLARTRRFFRLQRKANRQSFAGGLEYHFEA